MQKMKKPEFSQEAKTELFQAASFIADDNPTAAKQWRNQIYEACHLLAESPRIGRERSEPAKDLRSIPVGRFIIFYKPHETGVYIVHVLRGAMDIDIFSE